MQDKIDMIEDYKSELLMPANKENSKCPMPHSERVSCNLSAYYTVQGTMLCQYHAAEAMKEIVNLRRVEKYKSMGFSEKIIQWEIWGIK